MASQFGMKDESYDFYPPTVKHHSQRVKRERNYSELNRHGDGLGIWIQAVLVPWSSVGAVICTSVLNDRRQSAMACFLKMLVGALGRRVTAQCGELCGGCKRMA